jgi:tetratricopeptide (TPR) repeat protein
MITGDDQACVKEYSDLLRQYAADTSAHNNLALCASHLRDWPRALDEMKQVVQILPKRALYRVNLGLYAAYAGDFATAEREGAAARQMGSPLGWLPAALAQTGQERLGDAAASYAEFERVPAGASYAASGRADLALYQGRFREAGRLYEQGVAADLAAGSADRAAAKLAGLAYAELARGELRAAMGAAERALEASATAETRFQAARLLIEAGNSTKAREVAAELGNGLLAEPQAYAKILEGDIALKDGKLRDAVQRLTEANAILDTWIGRFDLGRAYLQAGAFTQADSEFDRCL